MLLRHRLTAIRHEHAASAGSRRARSPSARGKSSPKRPRPHKRSASSTRASGRPRYAPGPPAWLIAAPPARTRRGTGRRLQPDRPFHRRVHRAECALCLIGRYARSFPYSCTLSIGKGQPSSQHYYSTTRLLHYYRAGFRGTGQPRPLRGRRASPYVGQEARAIKAFSGEEIAALSNGEGTAWTSSRPQLSDPELSLGAPWAELLEW